MDLISELKISLDATAPQLAVLGRRQSTDRTWLIQNAIEANAPRYAQDLGIGYGNRYQVRAAGNRTLYMHRSKGKPLGQFLFDQAWLIAHSTGENGTETFPRTGELKNGYPIGCCLAAECEWNSAKHMYDDFCKLLVAKSTFKIFVYNSANENIADTLLRLEAHLESFEPRLEYERYLVSCYNEDAGRFRHQLW